MSQIGETHLRACVRINLCNAATVEVADKCAKTHLTRESNQIYYTRLRACLRSTIELYEWFMQKNEKTKQLLGVFTK